MGRKRQRHSAQFDPYDSDEAEPAAQYPTSLFESVDDINAWVSPTKAVKKYQKPLKRRQTNRTKGSSVSVEDQGYRRSDDEDEGPEPMPLGLLSFGPSDMEVPEALPHVPSPPRDLSEDPQVAAYAEAVDASVAVFQHIGNGIFVVQGWDSRRCQATVRTFYLLSLLVCLIPF
jgi:hypothetical protein